MSDFLDKKGKPISIGNNVRVYYPTIQRKQHVPKCPKIKCNCQSTPLVKRGVVKAIFPDNIRVVEFNSFNHLSVKPENIVVTRYKTKAQKLHESIVTKPRIKRRNKRK